MKKDDVFASYLINLGEEVYKLLLAKGAKKEDVLASFLIDLGEEVFRLLLAKGANKEDAEDIIQNTFYKV